jgi:hypothetical protein
VVGGHVAPSVQFAEVGQTRCVRRVGGGEVEAEVEALEILPEVLESGIAVVESPVGSELGLDQYLE